MPTVPVLLSDARILAAYLIFAGSYVVFALGKFPWMKIDRPGAAIIGAVLMVAFRIVGAPQALASIDFATIVLLFSMMLIVGNLRLAGFFDWVAEWIIERLHPNHLLPTVIFTTGLLSAFLVNDIVCLVMTPFVLHLTRRLGVPRLPYVLAVATASNIGSTATITGNPQNMLVGIWSGASFRGFLLHLLPVGLGGLAITYGYLRWAYRADLAEPFRERLETVPVALDRPLVVKGLVLFAGAVVAWLAGGPLPLVAIAAGALMVAVARRDPAYAIDRVEWSLLLFFASLFVVMRGLEQTGAVTWIDRHALALVQDGSRWSAAAVVSGVMAVLSNLISNVPAVMLWRNTVPQLPDPHLVWRVVAMSSTFAGNLLLIGSMANLIVAERAETRGVRIGFGEYARVGVPVTLLTLAWGVVVLVLTP